MSLPTPRNIVDPFANSAAVPAQVPGIVPKLGTQTVRITPIPTVPPAGFSQFFDANDKANIISSLAYVEAGIASGGQFLTLNTTEIAAINAVYTSWNTANPYGNSIPGIVHVPASGLQNTVIAMSAIGFLQTTGGLTTQGDLANSGGQITLVTGFAPNGADCITIHNQKVIACPPDQPFWYASNVGNAASWNPLSAGDLETYSDQPVAPDQCYGYLVIFGEQSLEWFQDVGNVPFPYQEIPGSAYNIGLPAKFSRAQFMGNLVFLGRFKTGQMHVFRTNGTSLPTPISTPDLDQIINNFPDGQYQDAVASTDEFNGHPVYILTFVTARRTFVFDGITSVWSEMQSGTAEYTRHMTTLRATLNNVTLASDWASGNVYIVDPNTYTDNGYIIPRIWCSKHVRMEGNEFSVPYLSLVMQVGTGAQNTANIVLPNTATPKIELSVSFDGGLTYGEWQEAELGQVGQYLRRVVWRQLGTARDFVFKFRCTDPVPFIVVAGYASVEPSQGD